MFVCFFRFVSKRGIGKYLVESRFTDRRFSQKIVWLVPTRDILVRATLFSVLGTVYYVI